MQPEDKKTLRELSLLAEMYKYAARKNPEGFDGEMLVYTAMRGGQELRQQALDLLGKEVYTRHLAKLKELYSTGR